MTDRRAAFFLVAAVLCSALVPVADHEHRWVAVTLAITYVVLAAASLFDARSRDRARPTRRSEGGDGGDG